MGVYVDNYQAIFGHMKMCHMIADTTGELLAMADKIGVQRKWLQKAGTPAEHFDICLSKRAVAIKNGAQEISPRDLVIRLRTRWQERKRCPRRETTARLSIAAMRRLPPKLGQSRAERNRRLCCAMRNPASTHSVPSLEERSNTWRENDPRGKGGSGSGAEGV